MNGIRFCFVFCFESFIYNPLHAARRAMAAALPLPSKEQRLDFLWYTRFLPRTSLRGYVEVTPFLLLPTNGIRLVEAYHFEFRPGLAYLTV